MELLAGGYGKRLLISGVHPTSGASDISRSLPDNQSLLGCCVDLDRSAVNTRSNAAETRRWVRERGFKSLIVVTSNYHMPRAIAEMSHAMPDVDADPVRGGRRQMARRAVVDQRRDASACCCRNTPNTSPWKCACGWPISASTWCRNGRTSRRGSLPQRPATAQAN